LHIQQIENSHADEVGQQPHDRAQGHGTSVLEADQHAIVKAAVGQSSNIGQHDHQAKTRRLNNFGGRGQKANDDEIK
jgi:hypothetical protein